MKRLFYIILLGTITLSLYAQSDSIGLPLIRNYTPVDYHGHYQTWKAVTSNDGFVYFANGDGLMSFDGTNWDILELPNEETARSITISDSGKIFIAGDNILGYLSVDSLNNLKFVSIIDIIPEKYKDFRVFWEIEEQDGVLYVRSSYYLIIIKGYDVEVHTTERPFFVFLVSSKNDVFVSEARSYSRLIDDSLHKFAFDKIIIDFFERNDTVFFVTTDNYIYYFDSNYTPVEYSFLDYDFSGTTFSKIHLYKDKYLIYSTYNKGLVILDFKGNLILKLDKETGLIGDNIYNSLIDNLGNIWVLTSNGISYVELASPLRMIDNRFDFDFSLPSFLSKFNNTSYTSTGHKFYQIDFKKGFSSKFTNITQGNAQAWNGIKIGDEFYVSRNTRILRIDKNNKTRLYGPAENIWKIEKVPYTENDYFVGGTNGLYHYKYDGDSLRFQKKIKNFTKSARELFFDNDNYLWIGQNNDGIYKIKLSDSLSIESSEFYSEEKGLTSTNTIRIFEYQDQMLISTYKTLFIYNKDLDSIYEFHPITDYFEIKNKRILQLIGIDSLENFWFEYYNDNYNSEIFCFKKEGDKFVETNQFAKRMLNFSLSTISQFSRNLLVFCTTRGYVFLDLSKEFDYKKPFKTFVRKIYNSTNDSILYGGNILGENGEIIHEFIGKSKLIVSFKNNNLRFSYSAPFFTEPERTQYRVKLLNYDDNWSSWSYDTRKDYTNLPPGNYEFQVEAKNIFDQYSEITSFKLFVKYPWYRTIYAYVVYVVLLILFLYLVIVFFTYRLKRRNEKLEKLVEERTIEITQKNIELEQQKEEILTQAEELQIVNQELEKLSTIVRETDNAVILADKDGNFIWINQGFTKIFGFTFEELVNKVSPNLIADRTEERVKKVVNKCLEEKVTVEYELKLKNKFGKEIWVHTTLTPLLDDEGEITSLVAIDADITKQKNYEEQILEQRDQITASIKYALKIQKSILPTEDEMSILFENFIIYEPKDIVSGDFYWISNIFKTENNRFRRVANYDEGLKVGQTVYFSVVDCTGHGVPGAFMSLIGSRLLGEIVNEMRIAKPKDILYHLDFRLSRVLKRSQKRNYDGMVVSICRMDKFIENEEEKINVTFAGAKQHITYYKQKTNEFIKLRGSARQIGFVVNESLEFYDKEFVLSKGDSIFLYSDGLKDMNNPQRESFGHSHIIRLLSKNITKPMPEIGDILELEMNKWLGDDLQRDDVTFIGLRIK
ncbi:MAG: PAS domain S-box protein [Bacteroidales bacterium]|nr:PAS domain S-box protein [Bacteroidales bacterium]